LTEQLKDPYLHKIYLHLNGIQPLPNLINKPYELRDGLIKIPRQNKYLIVIPSHLRDPVIKQYHDSSYALQGGITKTKELIMQKYYFPGITSYVQNYVSSCKKCLEFKDPNLKIKPGLFKSINATSCMQILTADILGPVTLLDEQGRPFKYFIQVLVDNFSK